jgi:hypothetical protein
MERDAAAERTPKATIAQMSLLRTQRINLAQNV